MRIIRLGGTRFLKDTALKMVDFDMEKNAEH